MRSSVSRPGNRWRSSALKSSISRAAIALNSALIASPDSSCVESTSTVLGHADQPPASSLENSGELARHDDFVDPSGCGFSQPAMWSKTSLDTLVLLQTTMNTGGVDPSAASWTLPSLERLRRSWRTGSRGRPAAGREAAARRRRRRSCGPSSAGLPGSAARGPVGRRAVGCGGVVVDRDPRDLHEPGLDGVDQREVRDNPLEQRPLRPSGAAEEEGRRRQVVHGLHADLGGDGLQPGDPDAGVLLALGAPRPCPGRERVRRLGSRRRLAGGSSDGPRR